MLNTEDRVRRCCKTSDFAGRTKVACICNYERCNDAPPVPLDWADMPACDLSKPESMADEAMMSSPGRAPPSLFFPSNTWWAQSVVIIIVGGIVGA